MKIALVFPKIRIFNDDILNYNIPETALNRYMLPYQNLSPLGLLIIKSLTPDNIHMELFDERYETLDYNKLAEFDVAAISGITPQAAEIYRITHELKKLNVKTICGGLHASIEPDEVAKHVDCVAVGEAESIWPKILQDLSQGTLKPKYIGEKIDLNSSPAPSYSLLSKYTKNHKLASLIITSNGCPHDCEFCSVHHIQGKKIRRKCTSIIRRDLQQIKESLGSTRFIGINDDNLISSKKHAIEVVKLIQEFKFRFFAQGDISLADDEELMTELALAKCSMFQIGLESVNSGNLMDLNPHQWKLKTFHKYKKSINKIQSFGIPVMGSFILGLDEDDENVFQNLYDFAMETKLTMLQFGVLIPLPKTRLYERLEKEGRLLYPDKTWDNVPICQFTPTYKPKNMSPKRLKQGCLWLLDKFYNGEEQIKQIEKNMKSIILNRIKVKDNYIMSNAKLSA